MRNRVRLRRFAALMVTGGVLVQAVGCASGIAPVLLSLGESVIINGLFNTYLIPI